jgi:hypothetical protein
VHIFGSSLSINGIDGDGKLTAVAGVLAAIFLAIGGAQHSRALLILGAVAGVGGAAVAIYDIVNVSDATSEAQLAGVGADVGVGLWLCGLSSIVCVVAAMVEQSNLKYSAD